METLWQKEIEVVYKVALETIIDAGTIPTKCHPEFQKSHKFCPTCGQKRESADLKKIANNVSLRQGFKSCARHLVLTDSMFGNVWPGIPLPACDVLINLPPDLHFEQWPCQPKEDHVEIILSNTTSTVKKGIHAVSELKLKLQQHDIPWNEDDYVIRIRNSDYTRRYAAGFGGSIGQSNYGQNFRFMPGIG